MRKLLDLLVQFRYFVCFLLTFDEQFSQNVSENDKMMSKSVESLIRCCKKLKNFPEIYSKISGIIMCDLIVVLRGLLGDGGLGLERGGLLDDLRDERDHAAALVVLRVGPEQMLFRAKTEPLSFSFGGAVDRCTRIRLC